MRDAKSSPPRPSPTTAQASRARRVGFRVVGSLFLVVGLLSLVAIAAGQVGATRERATVVRVQPAKPGQSDVHLLVRTEDGTTRNVTASSEEPRDYRVGQSVTLSLHRGKPAYEDDLASSLTGSAVAVGGGLLAWVISLAFPDPAKGTRRQTAESSAGAAT